jgi:hypothetical protein
VVGPTPEGRSEPGRQTGTTTAPQGNPDRAGGFAGNAFVLIGVLSYSGRWRGWISESIGPTHLSEDLDQVVRRLAGLTRRWRFDWIATVCHPDSDRLKVSFAPVAVHYQGGIDVCP